MLDFELLRVHFRRVQSSLAKKKYMEDIALVFFSKIDENTPWMTTKVIFNLYF